MVQLQGTVRLSDKIQRHGDWNNYRFWLSGTTARYSEPNGKIAKARGLEQLQVIDKWYS